MYNDELLIQSSLAKNKKIYRKREQILHYKKKGTKLTKIIFFDYSQLKLKEILSSSGVPKL